MTTTRPIPTHLRGLGWYAPHQAYLRDIGLPHHDPGDAAPQRAVLAGAVLRGADLTEAELAEAVLTDEAELTGAILPDGRPWEEYQADHLAGICDDPDVRARAISAWGRHQWTDCPMHEALGIGDIADLHDDTQRIRVAAWVALYDAGLLARPGLTGPRAFLC